MKVDIGNLQAAVWQTEEALDSKRLALEHEDDGEMTAVLSRSVAGLESLLAIQQRTLDFLVRQDGRAPGPPPSAAQALSTPSVMAGLPAYRAERGPGPRGQMSMSRMSRP